MQFNGYISERYYTIKLDFIESNLISQNWFHRIKIWSWTGQKNFCCALFCVFHSLQPVGGQLSRWSLLVSLFPVVRCIIGMKNHSCGRRRWHPCALFLLQPSLVRCSAVLWFALEAALLSAILRTLLDYGVQMIKIQRDLINLLLLQVLDSLTSLNWCCQQALLKMFGKGS